jgi:hypothetical protein
MFVNSRLAAMEGRVEVQEEGGGGVIGSRTAFEHAEDGVAFVHGVAPFNYGRVASEQSGY